MVLPRLRDALIAPFGGAARAWRRWLRPAPSRGTWPDRPVSRTFGFDRGTPVDRRYIEGFLAAHSAAIQGDVLEVGGATYTRTFGGERVRTSDVLCHSRSPAGATIVGDLSSGSGLNGRTFDCIIATQTLPFIYDVQAAVRTLHRLLRPNGALLLTVPGISQISRVDADLWGDYWRFTEMGLVRMLADAFGDDSVSTFVFGNVRIAASLLYGIAAEEIEDDAFHSHDPEYPVIIGAVARRADAVATA